MAAKNNGGIILKNPHLNQLTDDYLYHLGMHSTEVEAKFSDIKIIFMGGSANRMKNLAEKIQQICHLDADKELIDLTASANRFAMYKVGPILCISHGMGMPSLSILLHELLKLLHYAKCIEPIIIRLGTSGGIGVKPGTVIVTSKPVNGYLRNEHEFVILGKCIKRNAEFDMKLSNEIIKCCSLANDNFEILSGMTMAADDFYEGQGRLDGAICQHTELDKMNFLKRCYDIGVRNIEMEATILAAITNCVGIPSADICVTFLDRLLGDQVNLTLEQKIEFEDRPLLIACRYVKNKLNLK